MPIAYKVVSFETLQVRSQLKGKTQSGVINVLETHLSEMSIGKTNKSDATAVFSNTNDTAVDGPGSAPDGTNGEKENKDEDAKKEGSEKEE